MKVTELKERAVELKGKTAEFIRGDVTLTGLDFFLIGAICLLAGICIGFLTAPLTRGIELAIGSNNGNNNTGNGCHNGSENGNSDSHNC